MSTDRDDLPLAVVWRLGVTGKRDVPLAAGTAVYHQVERVIGALFDAVANAAVDPALAPYRRAGPARVRVVSPLAEGADRLVAKVALAKGDAASSDDLVVDLQVILPFAEADYIARFDPVHGGGTDADYTALRARAGQHVVELDGANQPDDVRHASYAEVGRAVVRNCDVLISIRDPHQGAKGPGGSADTELYACSNGVPVLRIDPAGLAAPVWITREGEPEPGDAVEHLRVHIHQAILPPQANHHDTGRLLVRLTKWLRARLGIANNLLDALFAEHGRHNFNGWRCRDALVNCAFRRGECRHTGQPAKPPARGNHPIWHCWRRKRPSGRSSSYEAHLSTIYQERYRTSYLFILILAPITVVLAAFGLTEHQAIGRFTPEDIATGLVVTEWLILSVIGLLWLTAVLHQWHSRYLSYRLLAELLRSTGLLRATLRTAPGSRLGDAMLDDQPWIAWLYAAKVRSDRLETGVFDAERKGQLREALDSHIARQINYHQDRIVTRKHLDVILHNSAILAFVGAMLAVTCKLLIFVITPKLFPHFVPEACDGGAMLHFGLALTAMIAPLIGVAVFTFRAYEELETLADQSKRIIAELQPAQKRLAKINPTHNLALRTLGGETMAVTKVLLHDVDGWVQLFKMKAIEG